VGGGESAADGAKHGWRVRLAGAEEPIPRLSAQQLHRHRMTRLAARTDTGGSETALWRGRGGAVLGERREHLVLKHRQLLRPRRALGDARLENDGLGRAVVRRREADDVVGGTASVCQLLAREDFAQAESSADAADLRLVELCHVDARLVEVRHGWCTVVARLRAGEP